MERTCLTIILAAGQGTRMKSDLPKVLHPIAGMPMVGHVAKCAVEAGANHLAVVVGHGADQVKASFTGADQNMSFHVQSEQRGTADAVNAARAAIDEGHDDVLVLFGDTPLVQPDTLNRARATIASGAAVCVVGFRPDDPTGYGRLLQDSDGNLIAIREHKDATHEERSVDFCNGGLMAFDGRKIGTILDQIGNDNAKGEFYLTGAVEIARGLGLSVTAIEAPEEHVLGVNNRVELSQAEAIWQERRRKHFMLEGVAMAAPETVFFQHDTSIATDVSLEPHVVFGPGVTIETGARIRAYCHLEGAHIGEGAEIGPFARLRPGTQLAGNTKIGNFCEIKNAEIGQGAKVNHLTYIGDAEIGRASNIGAGTITCNYDGANKHRTVIGENVFVGSNSALVAPVTLSDNAYVGSGSVITEDVPSDALAISRAKQVNKPGLAKRLRERIAALKAKKDAAQG
ncbi:MAG: bifunctional UDP-N-acetylglucosamine diphosphorylase/glucosamine-1-phosphate N-acetyltransferase GlmU [Pseudomonadota bacterium]